MEEPRMVVPVFAVPSPVGPSAVAFLELKRLECQESFFCSKQSHPGPLDRCVTSESEIALGRAAEPEVRDKEHDQLRIEPHVIPTKFQQCIYPRIRHDGKHTPG